LIPDQPIDFEQLAAICQGDANTMRKLLEAFDLQTEVLSAPMASEPPKDAAARAHTLAVTARSVGAWKVAESAEEFERVARGPEPIVLGPPMYRLSVAITELHQAISSFLAGSSG
jgi:HPt (histidine-containing phosphotransfer) domain-containing protein